MPIKNLSDRGRIPRIGKIHLGIRKKSTKGTEYPSATDYFVCPDEVKAVFGDQPKRLNITFHTNDVNEIFPQYYKRYGKSTGLVCRGDGETASQINPETGEMQEIECLGKECAYCKKQPADCKTIGNLYFMIPASNRFGVYQLDTSSYNSILNINGGLQFGMQLTSGRLAFIPFILEVIPQEVNPDGHKKTVYVLRLEADIQNMMKALDQKPREILSIEPPKTKDIEEDLHTQDLVRSIKPVEEDQASLWNLAKEAGYTEPQKFKEFLSENYGIESLKDLDWEIYDDVESYLNGLIEKNNSLNQTTTQEVLIK